MPFRVTSRFNIPTPVKTTRTYEELCNERAAEILRSVENDQNTLYVLWSGGIDSTLVLVSLLKNATPSQKQHIVVLMTEQSIEENPSFFRDHICGALSFDSTGMVPYMLGSRHVLLDGDGNDQLFGSDFMPGLIRIFGPSIIKKKYEREILDTYFQSYGHHQADIDLCLKLLERLFAASPIHLPDVSAHAWWINFTTRWQSVYMRPLTWTAERNASHITPEYLARRFYHFFQTEPFQLWSLNNTDLRIKDSWSSFKWICKDIIYQYTKDADYRDNKLKKPSFFEMLHQGPCYNFIDDSLALYRTVNIREYHIPSNDFI